MKKTSLLKNLLTLKNLDFILETHNGLSAKIVEEDGFNAIWAALRVRDNNEESWTQVLEVCEFSNSYIK